jgi:predicted DNA-binding transcriptional regulator AlpA
MTHTETSIGNLMIAAGADPKVPKRQAAALRGVSIATWDRMVKRGEIPRGEYVSPGRVAWRLSTITALPPAKLAYTPPPPVRGPRQPKADAGGASPHRGYRPHVNGTTARRGGKLRRADREGRP